MDKTFVHPSAIIEDNVSIGKGTKIWVNSQIRNDVNIGESCNIGKDTFIDSGITVGNFCKIQNGVSLYHGITIGDKVFIGPNAVFTNDMYPRAFNQNWKVTETTIQEGASIGANATIVCGVTLGRFCMIGSGSVVTKDVPDQALVVGNPAHIIGYVCECGAKLDDSNYCNACNRKYDLNR